MSRRVKKPRAGTGNGTGHVSGPGNNNIYRQTRYQHIATGRNSAVIPTKISKRASTASTYNVSQQFPTKKRFILAPTNTFLPLNVDVSGQTDVVQEEQVRRDGGQCGGRHEADDGGRGQ